MLAGQAIITEDTPIGMLTPGTGKRGPRPMGTMSARGAATLRHPSGIASLPTGRALTPRIEG